MPSAGVSMTDRAAVRTVSTARLDIAATLALVTVVTALRIAVLALTPTDLFLDEAQYWAWAQDLEWGYFSKPPLIAAVIGATTGLAGSDAEVWVRLGAPLFHGATALILAAWARSVDPRAGVWVAAVYLSMPVLAVGSWIISTDTIMAPFLAGALWAWWRHLDSGSRAAAIAAGVLAGLATMGKYAGVYVWLAVAVAAFVPSLRPGRRGLWLAVAAYAVVVAPNIVWNVQHGLVTFSHIADNASAGRGLSANWRGLAEFLIAQAFVIGPVFFIVWLGVLRRRTTRLQSFLLAASVPVLALVTVQSFTAEANANWAFAAYPAAALLVGLQLAGRARTWLFGGLAVNGAVVAAVTAVILWPDLMPRASDRYMARTEVMEEVIAMAGGRPIVAEERELLADLVYAAGVLDAPVEIYALRRVGPPRHWYDMAIPRPSDVTAVYLTTGRSPKCLGDDMFPQATITPEAGAYAGRTLALFVLPDACMPQIQ
jgi:4-amino-4-deoxy-L-arabinose transferase-like glycosyltransferase